MGLFRHKANKDPVAQPPSVQDEVTAFDIKAATDGRADTSLPFAQEGSADQQTRVARLAEVGSEIAKTDGLLAQAGVMRPRQAQLAESARHMPQGHMPEGIHVSNQAAEAARVAQEQAQADSTLEQVA